MWWCLVLIRRVFVLLMVGGLNLVILVVVYGWGVRCCVLCCVRLMVLDLL